MRLKKSLDANEVVDFDTSWASLALSLEEIHTRNASKLSFEQLYRNAYRLVLKKKGDALYQKVKSFERDWLTEHIFPGILKDINLPVLVDNSANGSGTGTGTRPSATEVRIAGERLLEALKRAWEDHITCMNMITDILMYMDRVYCTDNKKPSIYAAAMVQFRECILRTSLETQNKPTITTILFSVILNLIRTERDGDVIEQNLIKACIYMLEGLYDTDDEDESSKLYLTEFEKVFLDASREFYKKEGQQLLGIGDAGTYCRHAVKRLKEEADRCRSTLSILTLPKITRVVEEELIQNKIKDVIGLPGSGVKFMLDNDRLDELKMIYDLVSRVDPKKEELKDAVQKRVVELGNEVNRGATITPQAAGEGNDAGNVEGGSKPPAEKPIATQTTAAIKWVGDVLKLKAKYDDAAENSFAGDNELKTSISRSFAEFINSFDRCSEFLSLFFDENMKKGIKGKTEHEVDTLLDNGIIMLRFIQDKDLFETYYKKHLSKRLLMKRSISMDAERQMISKMKLEVGNNFTQKIEAMFKDMAVSEDLTSSYSKYIERLGSADKKRAELDIDVLTTTMWPLEALDKTAQPGYQSPQCNFPPVIESMKDSFQKFYLNKHSGRQLTFRPDLGTADLRAYFPEAKSKIKTRELNVSTYGMVVLMLFNDLAPDAFLTCEDIQARTGIPLSPLLRNLQSLAVAPKTRVLRKEPMSKDVNLTDKFFFNDGFTSQALKVKIMVVAGGNHVEDTSERRETERKNNDSRGHIIEAAVVRIMK